MTYHLGVDLGTTATTAAVHRAGRAGVVILGERSAAIPSLLLWPAEGSPLIGDDAERRAADEPTRIARGIRPRLLDPVPFSLGGAPFAASALLGVLLRRVVDLVAQREGGAPDGVVLTHPATWGSAHREAFADVAASLGLGEVALVTAPEAAVTDHLARRGVVAVGTLAVVDLGGGSLDATVVAHGPGGLTVLGRPEGVEHPDDEEPTEEWILAALHRTLASAGLGAADLDGVLLTGRSTRMGVLAASLTAALGRPVEAGPEPEHAVAIGAARLGAHVAAPAAPRPPRPVVDAEPVTAIVEHPVPAAVGAVGAVGAAGAAGLPAPSPAGPVVAPPRRRSRRGLVAGLAAAAIVLGAAGGGTLALLGAASPAVAAPPVTVPAAPVAAETTTTTTTEPAEEPAEEPDASEPTVASVAETSTSDTTTHAVTPRTRTTTTTATADTSDHRPRGSHDDRQDGGRDDGRDDSGRHEGGTEDPDPDDPGSDPSTGDDTQTPPDQHR
ncbi:Hsp70 family protein [Actinomycetospora lemnae]|uniref:Hsp70 family protein n=1 Tax=Actinomycetospora lemnae TaxID=3019891 RepID=A0ABT5T1Y3_9PSEU|nr:Hsp70 family protein [Actinomycetospora sp. DW7H6]MDD7969117.1 Hsp70 family protein [Actinomycetospora sp. DW7H6]